MKRTIPLLLLALAATAFASERTIADGARCADSKSADTPRVVTTTLRGVPAVLRVPARASQAPIVLWHGFGSPDNADIARSSPAVLLIHGADDAMLPSQRVQSLYDALRPHYLEQHHPTRLQLDLMENLQHDITVPAAARELNARVSRWMIEHRPSRENGAGSQ